MAQQGGLMQTARKQRAEQWAEHQRRRDEVRCDPAPQHLLHNRRGPRKNPRAMKRIGRPARTFIELMTGGYRGARGDQRAWRMVRAWRAKLQKQKSHGPGGVFQNFGAVRRQVTAGTDQAANLEKPNVGQPWRGAAGPGGARLGEAGRGGAGPGKARRGWAWQGKAKLWAIRSC